jgi:hypothetical protein
MSGALALTLLIAQVIASVGMFGVIWTIQLVHYPLMRAVPADAFVRYEELHTRAITMVVGPTGVPTWSTWAGGVAEAVAIGVTAFVSAPTHGRLEGGFDAGLLDRLIATNWFRTVAWTARAGLAVFMLVAHLNT